MQKILGYLLFDNPLKARKIKNLPLRNYLQSDLWKYGISGDFPIILVTITDVNDIYVVRQILKAYEFFLVKNFQTEIVILNEENYSYDNYVKEEIERVIQILSRRTKNNPCFQNHRQTNCDLFVILLKI